MIAPHLPALQVVIPLLAAPICAALRGGRAAWAWALAVSVTMPAIAGMLLLRVRREGPISYWIGSWEPPWGIEYRIDATNALVLLLVSLIGAVVTFYARASVEREIADDHRAWYYTMYLLCLAGLLGMAATGDAFNVFVFLEIASLSTYVLIALGRDRRALFAAYRYLVLGTIGATFYIIGIGFIYVMTGTLNIADLAARLPLVAEKGPVAVGFAFIAAGLCLKIALFPLHVWLPNAYAFAPSAATAFLAATATKVSIYLLLRFVFVTFGDALPPPLREFALPTIWIGLALAAMFLAAITAINQNDVKRMLAYSSVAQIGYITLGIGLASQTALTGAIVHLFNHALMKGALFMLVGGIAWRAGAVTIDGIAGAARRMPLTFAGIVVAGLSMVGVPGTVGFVGKWYLILAALERGWWWLAALVVASSLLTLVYVGRIVEAAYLRPGPRGDEREETPRSMLAAAWLLVAACIYFGLDTDLTVGVAAQAARDLLGPAR